MPTGVTGTETIIPNAFVVVCAVGVVESVTLIVKSKVPEAVGVPEIWPLEGFRLRPPGSAPALMLQL